MQYKLTIGERAEQQQWRKTADLELNDLLGSFLVHEESEKKDGMCFVPATLLKTSRGFVRTAQAVSEVCCLVYDVDEGNLDETKRAVEESGYTAILYTTHSHRTARTLIKTDHYAQWKRKTTTSAKATPDIASMQSYLQENAKGYLTVISLGDGESGNKYIQTGDGTFWVVNHEPLDKCRILFPLKTPIKLVDLHHESKQQIEIYKSIYRGVGDVLGLKYDLACQDPCRLHYMPSHPPGGEFWCGQFPEAGDGKMLDWTEMPRATLDQTARGKSKMGEWNVTDNSGVSFNLMSWVKHHGAEFDIAAVLEEVLPEDMMRDELSNSRIGFHVECPFEHEHSTTGGTGTYIETDLDKGFVFRCRHNSCNTAKRSRLDFLKKWIEDGYLSADDLGVDTSMVSSTNEGAQLPPEADDAARVKESMSSLGIDESVLYDDDELLDIDQEDSQVAQAESQDSDAIRAEYLGVIKDCRYCDKAVNALTRLNEAKVHVTEAELIEALVHSQISMTGIKEAARVASLYNDGLSKHAVSEDVRVQRHETYSIHERMQRLITECRAGSDLERLKLIAAEFYGVTYGHINKQYKEQIELTQTQEDVDSAFKDKVARFSAMYCKVDAPPKTMIADIKGTLRAGVPKLFNRDSIVMKHKADKVTAIITTPGGERRSRFMSTAEYCLDHQADFPTYNGITFVPGQPRITTDHKLNMWTGFHIKPAKSGDAGPIVEHINDVWCGNADDHTKEWIRTYLAHIFQRPWEKPQSAVVLGGTPGAGKGVVFDEGLSHMCSPYYGKSSRPEDICGQFTAYSANKLVFVSEEALWAGDKKFQRALKERVVGPSMQWEEKHMPRVDLPDYIRLFFTSNETHMFDLAGDDRRYCILETSDIHLGDAEYFIKLIDWLNNGGREKWLRHLLDYKPQIAWGELRTPPLTEARRRQIQLSRPASTEFFFDLITHGRITTLPRDVETDTEIAWPLDGELIIRGDLFRIVFDQYIRWFDGSHSKYERGLFFSHFERYFGGTVAEFSKQRKSDDPTTGKKRSTVIVLPPRLEVMKRLSERAKPEISKEEVQWAKDNPLSHQRYDLDH